MRELQTEHLTLPSSTRRMIPEIDGLRGIAILLVFFTHFWPSQGSAAIFRPIAQGGWIGVDLFFVISGFLIMGILIDTKSGPGYYRNFYARRILRIFPLYYAFLAAVFIGMPIIQGAGSYAASAFGHQAGSPAWYMLYLTNFREVLGDEGIPPFIRPLWSLAIEEQFYLLFPFVVIHLGSRALTRVLIGLTGFALLFRVGMYAWLPANHHVQYLLTPARFDTIALGSLLAIAFRTPGQRIWSLVVRAAPWLAVTLLTLVGITSGFDRRDPSLRLWGYTAIAIAFAALVAWVVERGPVRSTAILRNPMLMSFGKLCYGLYVLHIGAQLLVLGALRVVAPAVLGESWLTFPIAVAAAYLVAWLSWRLFESPILRLKRHFVYSSPGTPLLAAARSTRRMIPD